MSDRRYTYFWKKTHCSFVSRWMGGLVLWLFILTACVGEELQKPLLGEGEGYLTLQVDAISAEVTSDPLTKATLENLPAQADFAITIKDASGSVMNQFDKLSEIKNPLVLKAGVKYTVEAYHGTNEALQDSPYFSGSEEVTIQANTNNSVTVTASLGNAMITPIVNSSLTNHYKDDWTLEASAGGKTLPLASAAKGVKTLYARAREIVSLTFAGTNKAEQPVSFTWTATGAVEPCTEYKLQCDPDLSAFNQIEVKATATHTTDASGYLNGTDVVLTSNLNGANGAAIQSWTVKVQYDGQDIRTYTGDAPTDLKMTKTNDWPYIPQGSTLSASVELKAGDVITVGSSLALSAPTFGVEVTGETSYSVYKDSNRGANAANQTDGSSIFNIGSTVKISSEILIRSNYANILPKVTYTTDTGQNSGELAYDASVSDFTDLTWQKHVLTATATFDGGTASATMDCHVTGLPYYKDFKKANIDGWTGNGNYEDYTSENYLGFKPTDAWILSPQFYVPENNLNILVSLPVYAYHTNSLSKGSSPTLYVSVSNEATKSGYVQQFQSTNTVVTSSSAEFETIEQSFSFSSNISQLSIYVYCDENKNFWTPDIRRFMVKDCSIDYK